MTAGQKMSASGLACAAGAFILADAAAAWGVAGHPPASALVALVALVTVLGAVGVRLAVRGADLVGIAASSLLFATTLALGAAALGWLPS